ncbi:MAG: putative oxidoreductase [Acidimicrobiia bacterium]|nr:putative oxidoreductase [Acidimicrobiia bacterium]
MSKLVGFTVDGHQVEVADDGASLLEVLRDRLGQRSAKDGCSPQGQCGCCTVLVDGQARVACVTPLARVAGRAVTTAVGLPDAQDWAAAFSATGASQCGFCTPGIIVRLSALDPSRRADRKAVDQSLLAHLCRCTGWQTIREACAAVGQPQPGRNAEAAAQRAALEGGVTQRVDPDVALGGGGFADDRGPLDALVAVMRADGQWAVEATLAEARRAAGKVQGRRTTAPVRWPLDVPPGQWSHTLATCWVEPAYLEPDASWCEPGGEPAGALGNGGAFGGKRESPLGEVARRLANEHGRAVRVLWSREDVVRFGPKRPPVAAGVRADGTGVMRVVRTAGIVAAIAAVAPGLEVEELDSNGPPTSASLRGAGWVEAAVLVAAATNAASITAPNGARASASIEGDGSLHVTVRCGQPLDATVLRSYCIGAAHQALGWVRSEGIAVDAAGEPHDLTIRSFGILRAVDMPEVTVTVEPSDEPPVNGSDAVFAAVALAAWRAAEFAPRWPVNR